MTEQESRARTEAQATRALEPPPTLYALGVADAVIAAGPPMERPPLAARVGSLVVIVVPLLGLLAAILMLWGVGFSWVHLGLLLGGYLLTSIGVTVGYHRLFTHASFRTNAVVKIVLGALGSMAVEGPILRWVATHRMHHQHSDRDLDPHSPHGHGTGLLAVVRGFMHAHLGWFFTPAPRDMKRYIPDLIRDRVTRVTSGLFPLWVALGLVLPAALGLAMTGSWLGALLGLIWGGLVRIFLVQHVTWSVNSVCHLWGGRPFRSHDHSRNNLVFGILALGEGWHNNHHAFPASARHGLSWWQVDVSYWIIRGLALLRLASDVRVPAPERIAAKRRAVVERGAAGGL
jgi:stearoyl-CoA desaturase (delta-9 desaturase)